MKSYRFIFSNSVKQAYEWCHWAKNAVWPTYVFLDVWTNLRPLRRQRNVFVSECSKRNDWRDFSNLNLTDYDSIQMNFTKYYTRLERAVTVLDAVIKAKHMLMAFVEGSLFYLSVSHSSLCCDDYNWVRSSQGKGWVRANCAPSSLTEKHSACDRVQAAGAQSVSKSYTELQDSLWAHDDSYRMPMYDSVQANIPVRLHETSLEYQLILADSVLCPGQPVLPWSVFCNPRRGDETDKSMLFCCCRLKQFSLILLREGGGVNFIPLCLGPISRIS